MEILIDKSNAGKTIRSLLRDDLSFSSSLLKKVKFSPGGITVNGEFRTVRYQLAEGDRLSVAIEDRPEDVSPYITPVELPIGIIHEDDQMIVVNKPPFMPAHPSFGHRDDTVANALSFLYSDKPYVFRPVNRLDRDTSGVMIVARSKTASYTLNREMAQGNIRKTYLALAEGSLPQKQGVIETYMRRVADSVIMREVCSAGEGAKRAITKYKVLLEGGGASLVAVCPITGRTHQIRVHFAYAGAPIVGDSLYGSPSDLINRQALHAFSVSLNHPENGEPSVYKAELPEDIKNVICRYFGEAEAYRSIEGL